MTRTVTITVVFTDLVGSTELAARLGPAAAEDLRSTHFGLLRDAVARTGGTEVKNLGDGLMVVFPSLGGALDATVAMQQNIERHNRKTTEPLDVRIGLSNGDATMEDDDYFGDPVVEAARLCDSARGGQIVTTETVKLLARRSDHGFTALGPMELRGLPEPVIAWEVEWAPVEATAQVPLPNRLALAPPTGVVGRTLERERLGEALKAAFGGEGHRMVLMSGEPGIGKTTLAGDLARQACSDGATVAYGRCDEDLRVPYQPFVEALGDYLSRAPESALLRMDRRGLSELSRLLPQVRDRIPDLEEPPSTDAEAERYLLFGAVTALLVGMASTAPVVVILDDLHWADKPSVVLLRHLVATLDRAEVLVVGTYRDSDLTMGHPLADVLAALWSEPAVDRMTLGGLDDDGVVALFEGLAGHLMDDEGIELAQSVRRETGGNPFFTSEVLRHLAETSTIPQDDGRWVASVQSSPAGLPESIREVVGQRVRRLGDDVHQILTLASVIGRDFELSLLAALAQREEDDVLDALEAAASAAVVAEAEGRSERFTFTHALFQQTLYEALSVSRRTRTHRRIGELLEAAYGDDPGDRFGALAQHWIAASTPSDSSKAARYARRAGERALGALAPDEAIRWFHQALALLDVEASPDAYERLDVLIGLGEAQRQVGDPCYRETLLDAAAEAARLGDAGRLVTAVLANQRGVAGTGAVDSERIAMLERALEAVKEDDDRSHALLLASLAQELPFSRDLPRVRALSAEALSIARDLGDDATLLRVLTLTFLPLLVPDAIEQSLASSEEALALATRVGDPVARYWAAIQRANTMACHANREGIDHALELAVSLADEIGQPYLAWQALTMRCSHTLRKGDVDQAERLADQVLQVGLDSGQPDVLAVYGGTLAGIRWHQGRLEEILPLMAQASEELTIPAFQAGYAAMLCECGQADQARSLLDGARAQDFHTSDYNFIWLTTTTYWAEVAASLGDVAVAGLLFERLAPFAEQGITTGATFTGTVEAYLARVAAVRGDHDDALVRFERADQRLRALQAPFWHARNQVAWARVLVSRANASDLHRSRELLAEATATAATFGCAGVERQAAEVARSLP